MKYMDLKEFREIGYLHEINRLILHPLGLALEITVDDLGQEHISGIQDHRDIPCGYSFLSPNEKKAENIRNIQEERKPQRLETLGYWIQPLGVSSAETM